ncbi:MAG: polysaccharide deacetylase family protein [Melioribacteraceae bacterium]|nr:polysaccharide deacetylase family protein [Melioribacteraceae bacterium]
MSKLKKYLYNPPKIVKKVFNNFQWDSINEEILITFDDGPNPNTTELILRELENQNINAVFFCVGENLEKYPSLAKEIISSGHLIGNHTHQHRKITTLSNPEIIESIVKVQKFADEYLNYKIQYFRPPHGRFNLGLNKLLAKEYLINVMWSLLTYDYKNDLNIVKFAVNNYLMHNSIIVLHDSNKSKNIITDSIKYIVEATLKCEYQIGKPSECLKSFS